MYLPLLSPSLPLSPSPSLSLSPPLSLFSLLTLSDCDYIKDCCFISTFKDWSCYESKLFRICLIYHYFLLIYTALLISHQWSSSHTDMITYILCSCFTIWHLCVLFKLSSLCPPYIFLVTWYYISTLMYNCIVSIVT